MQVNHDLIVEPTASTSILSLAPSTLAELFGNDHPSKSKVGIGKGTFITEQAKARPENQFPRHRMGALVLALLQRPPPPQPMPQRPHRPR